MEKFSSEDRNPQCETERERNEQCGGNIRIAQPPHLMKTLEDIGHEPAEIVGNHDNRQTFDRVLKDGLALRRLVDADQERQVLGLSIRSTRARIMEIVPSNPLRRVSIRFRSC